MVGLVVVGGGWWWLVVVDGAWRCLVVARSARIRAFTRVVARSARRCA